MRTALPRLVIAVVCLIACAAARAACPDLNTPPYSFGQLGNGFIVSADFDADGNWDAAATNTNSNSLSVFIGNGDGTFAAAVNYAVGSMPTDIATGDIDNDGDADLVTANLLSSTVSVLRNNGNGTFAAATAFSTLGNPRNLVIAHLNGDANLDLAVTRDIPSTVAILLGNGNGTFQPAVQYPVTNSAIPIVTNDFDNDGDNDLAIGNFNATISILKNNGNGTFGAPTTFFAGGGSRAPLSLASADFDGDGNADIAAPNASVGTFAGNIAILRGNGDGTFQTAVLFDAGVDPLGITVTDLNADGELDLSVSNFGSHDVVPLFGVGDGTFTKGRSYLSGHHPGEMEARDWDEDGLVDLLVGHSGSNASGSQGTNSHLSLLIGDGAGGLAAPVNAVAGEFITSIAVGDLNGDGRPDLVAPANQTNTAVVMLNAGDGSFLARTTYPVAAAPNLAAIGDFTGDRKNDIVMNAYSTDTVSILVNNGDGTFQPFVSRATGDGPYAVAAADFNRDSKLDLAVTMVNVTGRVGILLGNGDSTFAPIVTYAVGASPYGLEVSDFNNDGFLDLATGNVSGTPGTVSILLGNGDGTFDPAVSFPTDIQPYSIDSGDFNEDGNRDIVTVGQFPGTLSFLMGNGAGAFAPPVTTPGMNARWVAVGDFNRDNFDDLAVAAYSQNTLLTMFGNGDGTFQPAVQFFVGSTPNFVLAADFDGDRGIDIAVAHPNSRHVSPILNRTSLLHITTPNSVAIGATGITATVPKKLVTTHSWTLTGGTITSGQGTRSITYDAGSPGTRMTLSAVESPGACGAPVTGTKRVMVDYIDVPPTYLFHDWIITLARNGITSGCEGGFYCPEEPVLRSQMAIFLLRGRYGESYTPPPATGVFADVPIGSFAANFIERLYAEGITTGCDSDPLRYCPNNSVLRSQMAIFLLRSKHGPSYVPPPATGIFADVPIGSFAANWIEQLYREGITGGCFTNPLRYCPDSVTTRGAMAVFLTRTFNLQ